MKRVLFIVVLMLFAGCSADPSPNQQEDKALTIYTSIYPLQYAAEQIAGEDAHIESIYPPGVDAHTYEPATKDVTAIAEGDVFLYLGAGMESFASSVKNALEMQPIEFVSIEEKDADLFASGEEENTHQDDLDPHIWFDPMRMVRVGEIIRDELTAQSPELEGTFEDNFDRFKQNMEALNKTYHDTLDAKEHKSILVTHAAYGYWEEAYGLDQLAINGISSSDEPSQKELTEIAKIAEDHHIKYVIFEANSSNNVASIIQDYIDAKSLELHNLETLTDEDVANNEDYLSLMEQNLQVLDQATN